LSDLIQLFNEELANVPEGEGHNIGSGTSPVAINNNNNASCGELPREVWL
jgi:hypothetical protein